MVRHHFPQALEPEACLCFGLTLKTGDSQFHQHWHLHPRRAASSQPLWDLAVANLNCLNLKSPPGICVSTQVGPAVASHPCFFPSRRTVGSQS